MSICVLEINDIGIRATVDDELRLESPGFAILDEQHVVLGEQALGRARLDPRHTQNRFWDQLSLDPLTRPTATVKNQADLTYLHLQNIWKEIGKGVKEVIVAVPGIYDKHQLGLLLGIAQECQLPVVGIVDSAVAAAAPIQSGRNILVLDLQLHRAVLTRLVQGDQITRENVEDVVQAGLIALYDAWANVIADAFVQTTRFDPLQLARTEQALYDGLPGWLSVLRSANRAVLELPFGHKTHTVTVERSALVRAGERIYRKLAQIIRSQTPSDEPVTLEVSHRTTELPGFATTIAELADTRIIELGPKAVAGGVLAHKTHICSTGEGMSYVTSLPLQGEGSEIAAVVATETTRAPPTHLLHEARAYPILQQPFVVGTSVEPGERGLRLDRSADGMAERHCLFRRKGTDILVEDLSKEGVFVNGAQIDHSALVRTGDVVRLGRSGVELRLILVAEDDGA